MVLEPLQNIVLPQIIHYWSPSAKPIRCRCTKLGFFLIDWGLICQKQILESPTLPQSWFAWAYFRVCTILECWYIYSYISRVSICLHFLESIWYHSKVRTFRELLLHRQEALYNGAVWVRQMEISSVLMTINVPSAMPPYNARLSNGFFAILVANSPVMDSTQDSDSNFFTIIENPQQIRNWYTDRNNVEDSY